MIVTYSCNNPSAEKESSATDKTGSQTVFKAEINKVLEAWHEAEEEAHFEHDFDLMAGVGSFIGRGCGYKRVGAEHTYECESGGASLVIKRTKLMTRS